MKPLPNKIAILEQSFDVAQYGYPFLTPVFGMRIFSHFLSTPDHNRVRVVVQPTELSRDNMERYRGRYVSKEHRLDNAWQTLETAFPGLNRNLVKLLIAAKGISEGGVSMPPMIFITGPTGSAKSGTSVLTASMCGDHATEVVWTNNIERVRQAINDSKQSGMFVVFNEITKLSIKEKKSPVEAMDFILNLTPGSTSWKIWTGPVKLGDLPVFVFTDTNIPIEIKQDAQLARRLTHVHIADAKTDWPETLKATEVNQIDRVRIHSPIFADACNSIVSDVIDEFFSFPQTFETISAALGFAPLSMSSEAEESKASLKKFFEIVCLAPDISGPDSLRWSGPGWKLIVRGNDSELLSAWEQVCDPEWTDSRRCSGEDWARLLGKKTPMRFECRANGVSKVAVRFRSMEEKMYTVNGDLT
jgi:hypothetical protein